MIKVAIVQRIFTHYRKAIFDSLAQQVDLTLLHSSNTSGIKQGKAAYSHTVPMYKVGRDEMQVFINIFPYLFKKKPEVLIHEFAVGIVSLPLVVLYSKIFNVPLVLWSHGYNRKTGFKPTQRWSDRYRYFLMKQAKALLVYGQEDKKFLSQFIPGERIFVAQNTIDVSRLTEIRDKLERIGRKTIKQELNYGDYNLIYIGRILQSKHPDILLDVYDILKDKLDGGLKIHFVGEGVELVDKMKQVVSQKGYGENILFYGHISDDEQVGKMLYAADMMVMPGKLGLSINHAFCFDCPVTSFAQKPEGPFHSPEVEYLISDQTGFLVEHHTAEALADKIRKFLVNNELQQTIKENVRQMTTDTFPVERMVQGFVDAAFYVTQSQKLSPIRV